MEHADFLKLYSDFKRKVQKKFKTPIAEIHIKDVKGNVVVEIIPDIPVTKMSFSQNEATNEENDMTSEPSEQQEEQE